MIIKERVCCQKERTYPNEQAKGKILRHGGHNDYKERADECANL